MKDKFDRFILCLLYAMIILSVLMLAIDIIKAYGSAPAELKTPQTAAEATQEQLEFCNSTPYEIVGCPTHVPTPTTSAGDPSAYPGITPVCQPYPWLDGCQEADIFSGLPAVAEATPTPVVNPFIGIPRPGRK